MELIDFEFLARPDGPREQDTVLQMVQKLEALSTALTNFGGVPSVLKSPKEATLPRSAGKPRHPAAVDGDLERSEVLHVFAVGANACVDEVAAAAVPQEQKNDNPLDSFLGMFDNDEEPSKDKKATETKLDYRLPEPR